jgi:uncharacterized protein
MTEQHDDTRPWHRQFWPWFLIALPGSVVIAAFATLAIAIKHSDEVVRDDYYKDGLAINQQLERVQAAQAMNLTAALTWRLDSGEISVALPAAVVEQHLQLRWLHPLKQQQDRDIVLTRRNADTATIGSIYSGQIDPAVTGRFYLQLENALPSASAGAAWRLRGEIATAALTNGAVSITLTP